MAWELERVLCSHTRPWRWRELSVKNEMSVSNSLCVCLHISRGAFAQEREPFPASCAYSGILLSSIDIEPDIDNPNKN